MWISIILIALLFAIVLTQSSQGMFSALISTVLTLCCAAAALGTYEWAAVHIAGYWKPNFAHAIALAATFGVPLLVFRLIFDKTIRRSCLLPAWVDRAGGGVCGVVTGLVMVGIFAACIQMLPFGGSIVGFQPIPMSPPRGAERGEATPPSLDPEDEAGFWLAPDRFMTSVATVLADGIFSGKKSFYVSNPDLVQAAGWVGAVRREVSRFAPPRSISVVDTAPLEYLYRLTPGIEGQSSTYEPDGPPSGKHFRAVRVSMTRAARDANNTYAFTLRQFRLVGRRKGSDVVEQFFPVGIQDENDGSRHIRYTMSRGKKWPVVDEIYIPTGEGTSVEIAFELPDDFEPSFIEYKRSARASMTSSGKASSARRSPRQSKKDSSTAEGAPTEGADANANPSGSSGDSATGRRVRGTRGNARAGRQTRGVGSREGGSHFGDDFPLALKSYRGDNVELQDGALVSGKLNAITGRQENGRNDPINKFFVPEDKRLLQLDSVRLKARSTLGRALGQAVTTVQNYFVEDANGERYSLVGKYAKAKVRGRQIIEVQYFSGPRGSIGGLGKFSRIKENDLKETDDFVLLFLVNPGAQIVAFSTGGAATQREDLLADKLTAPE